MKNVYSTVRVRYPFLFLAAVLWIIIANQSGCETEASATEDRIRFIVQGYLSNRGAFERYRCETELRQGKCVGIASAVSKGPERDVVKAIATLVVDGEQMCYLRESNDRIKMISATQGTVSIVSGGRLSDGSRLLDVDFTLQGASIGTGTGDADSTTWNGAGALRDGREGEVGYYLQRALATTKVAFEIRDQIPVDENLTTRVDVIDGDMTISFFVDEERGFIPLETWLIYKGTMAQKIFVTNIRHCSHDRWFPARSISVWIEGDEATGEHTACEIRLTNLDVDYRSDSADFRLTLPVGMSITDGVDPRSNVTLTAEEKVGLADLEQLFLRTQRKKKEREITRRTLDDEPGFGRRMILIANVLVVVVLLVLVWRWHRRR